MFGNHDLVFRLTCMKVQILFGIVVYQPEFKAMFIQNQVVKQHDNISRVSFLHAVFNLNYQT